MQVYSPFDYLCNESYFVDGIGHLKCPTLREIRHITFHLFSFFLSILSITLESYLKQFKLTDQYNSLSEEDKAKNTLYFLLLYDNASILFSILSFFIVGTIKFNSTTNEFDIFDEDNGQGKLAGHVNNENFELLRTEIQKILGLKKANEEQPKYKNTMAKNMFQKLQEHKRKQQAKGPNEDYEFDNMIRKYCTHNKVGINILNVWDMTYYQFTTMFNEYCNGRQHDFNDLLAANTFTLKSVKDYKPMDYIKNK